ncbi:endolytic transglycosylase MltG [Microbacterium gorillae]|uniref:endolytic transglycosylase MltG n=1 Tax=Microbacterium gorillae TaxID=1231063 RepID=UPI0006949D19|nr:endolytic transglycosylase MltG [Microbacterium gorillae]
MSTPSDPRPDDATPRSRRELRESAARGDSPETGRRVPVPPPVVAPAEANEATRALPIQQAEPTVVSASSLRDGNDGTGEERRARGRADVHGDGLTDMADLFSGEPVRPVDKQKKRRGRRRGCLWAFLIVLVILGAIAGAGAVVWNVYGEQIKSFMGVSEPLDYAAGQEGAETSIQISSGDTGRVISTTLFQAGVTKTDTAFYQYLVKSGKNPDFYPGVYRVHEKMTSAAALTALQDPANRLENSLLVREGDSTQTILPALAEVLGVDAKEVTAAAAKPKDFGVNASSLEGWLFPATYEFDKGTSVHDALQKMVDRMNQSLDQIGVPKDDRQRILTIASIVQREGRTDDFPKVARVIMNRLAPDNTETHGLLQMDSTVAYGVGKMHNGVVSTTDEDRANDNPYNTYLHPGLPAGPIASPGDAAITAALHPADGPWYYFVTVNLDTGETLFAKTYAEQEANEKKWHEWCAANPDSGC